MKYMIADKQEPGHMFGDMATFTDKESVRKQLVSFHSVDSTNPEQLEKMSLDEILDYGQWELVEINA